MGVILYFVDFAKLAENLAQANFALLGLSVVSTLVWLAVRALAWRAVLEDRPSFTDTFFAVNEGYLLNNLFPLRLGELGRSYLLSQKAQLPFWQVISSVVVERSFDLAFTAGLVLATLPLAMDLDWAQPAAIGIAVIVALGLLGLFLLARYRAVALLWLEKLGTRSPSLLRWGGGILPNFINGLAALADSRRFLKVLGWMTLDWCLGILQYYLLIRAFIPSAGPLWAAFTLGIVALGVAAPSSPGNVGIFEGAIFVALKAFSPDENARFACAITVHLMQILITGALGALGLARHGETLLGLYTRIRNIRKPDLDRRPPTADC